MLSQGPCGLSSVSVDLGRKDLSWGPTGEVTLLGELCGSFLLGSISWVSPLRLKIFSLLSVTGSDLGVIDPISFTDSRERSWFFKDGFYPLIDHSPIALGIHPVLQSQLAPELEPSSLLFAITFSKRVTHCFVAVHLALLACAHGTTPVCTQHHSLLVFLQPPTTLLPENPLLKHCHERR